jgi:hypothetical protein
MDNQSDSILDYDLFEILGIELTEEEKEKQLDEMDELMWLDFLDEDLPKLIGEEEVQKIEQTLETLEGATFEDSADLVKEVLESKGYNLEEELVKRGTQLKKQLVLDQISAIEADSSKSKDPVLFIHIIKNLKDLFDQEKWGEMGAEFMRAYDLT